MEIAAGNFFFRHRNRLFPLLFGLSVLTARPRLMGGHEWIDALWIGAGMATALAGQAVRLATIGLDYIDRGGKGGQVHASRLVHRGLYAMTRNPMYLGNGLIAVGVCMAAGAPLLYVTVVPLFLWVYRAIVAAEEHYLLTRFGEAYRDYLRGTPRFLPALGRARRALAGFTYDWRKALRKELSTLQGLTQALIWLPLWRLHGLRGPAAALDRAPAHLVLSLIALVLFGLAVYLKKTRRFFFASSQPSRHP